MLTNQIERLVTEWLFIFSACGAGDRIKPGVERSGTPGTLSIYRASPRMRATAIGSISMIMK
jgi:hypothetical protein